MVFLAPLGLVLSPRVIGVSPRPECARGSRTVGATTGKHCVGRETIDRADGPRRERACSRPRCRCIPGRHPRERDATNNVSTPLPPSTPLGRASPPRRPPPRRVPEQVARGNTEGTSAWAHTSTPGHLLSHDSFCLRGFRARGCPRVPSVATSVLHGNEGVDGSSPSEGLKSLQSNTAGR
jgi:hypothetical protein